MTAVRQSRRSGEPWGLPIMKFTLTFRGDLPASGNKPKPGAVWEIRNQIAPQLEELWGANRVLMQLKREGWGPTQTGVYQWSDLHLLPGDEDRVAPIPPGWEYLVGPIEEGGHPYVPLVRKSLHMVCHLKILFLRREEPGELISQCGDLDNRIKTLFDALRIPRGDELAKGTPVASPLHCLLESDTLITGFDIRTDRYLAATSNNPKAVQLTVEVQTSLVRVVASNASLLAD